MARARGGATASTTSNLLLTEGRGGSGSSAPGAGTLEAVRQTVRLIGGLNWQYLSGESTRLLADDAGLAWTLGRAASVLAGALLALGVVTSAVRVARTLLRMRTWSTLTAHGRALLLVWLGCVWLSFAASATGRVYPHYLLVTYPVSFAVAALGLWDVAGLGRRRAAAAGAAATAVVGFVALAFVAFTLAFQSFLADYGGTAGDYGLVYRDKEALADDARARGLRVPDEPVLDLLVAGHDRPPATPPYVTVQNSLSSPTSLPCDAELRRYGLLEGCFPR